MSVSSEFGRRAADDELCAAVAKAVVDGDSDALRRLGLDGWGDYVQRLSELMNESVRDGLEQSDDFGALMSQVASPARYAHHLVTESGTAVQTAKDTPLGIHIKPLEPEFDDDALKGTVGTAANMDDPAQAVETLADGLAYAVKKAGNEFIEKNAEQRSRAGFEVSVKRSGSSKCCEWCAARIGSWALKNAPDGVFGCHAKCSCVVEYTSSTGAVSQRRGTGRFVEVEYQPPHVMTHEEAREKGGFDEPKRLTKNPVESQPHRLTGGENGGIINDKQRSKSYNDLIARLSSLGIVNNPTSLFSERPSEELIIGRLAGGDMTEGACTSLAWAYAGNKGGVDVLDFRGGGSCDFFARTLNSQTIAKFDGVISYTERNTNDFNAVTELLKKVESSKEYILITGKHTAVIKKSNKGFEYLEMQSATDNGFKPLTNAALKSRFGCKKTHKSYGYAMQASSILLDRQSLSDSDEFLSILGYINTPIDQQMKGDEGHEK